MIENPMLETAGMTDKRYASYNCDNEDCPIRCTPVWTTFELDTGAAVPEVEECPACGHVLGDIANEH